MMEDYSSEDDWEHRFEENQEEVKMENEKEREEDEGNIRDWKDLPSELLSQILTSFYLDDVKRFHKVCKNWGTIEDPKQHCPLKFPTMPSPWLVHKDTYDTRCKFFHPFYSYKYNIDIPELMSAALLHSNNGWLLMSLGSEALFFINPFTKERVNLPDLFMLFSWKTVIFSSEPTSPNCKVIGVEASGYGVCLYTISRGENSWNEHEIFEDDYDPPMHHSDESHPIFYNHKLYFLGKNGEMGVFDPTEKKWTTHEVSNGPREELTYESYLVECNGQLMAVFLSYMGTNISVLALDEKKMKWKKVDNLGDFMLFISVPTSFAIKKDIDGMENKIYFPKLYGDYTVFYCLATHSYKTFGNRFSQKDLFGTREQLNCCWTQPSAHPASSPEQLEWFLQGNLENSTSPT